MKSLGKTYLLEIEKSKEEITDGGIILPAEKESSLIHFKGTVVGIGLGIKEDTDIKVGDTVYFNWKEKTGKVKILMEDKIYIIVEEKLILAKEINE